MPVSQASDEIAGLLPAARGSGCDEAAGHGMAKAHAVKRALRKRSFELSHLMQGMETPNLAVFRPRRIRNPEAAWWSTPLAGCLPPEQFHQLESSVPYEQMPLAPYLDKAASSSVDKLVRRLTDSYSSFTLQQKVGTVSFATCGSGGGGGFCKRTFEGELTTLRGKLEELMDIDLAYVRTKTAELTAMVQAVDMEQVTLQLLLLVPLTLTR